MVRKQNKVLIQPYNKIPYGAAFYIRSSSLGPYVKTGRTSHLPANATPESGAAMLTLSPTTTQCVVMNRWITGKGSAGIAPY